MKQKQERLWKGFWELFFYILVGLATTFVSYGVRSLILYSFAPLRGIDLNSTDPAMVGASSALRSVAQTVGWIAAVLFAFLPNKILVFRDRTWGTKHTLLQFGSFGLSRVGTYFLELLLAVVLPILLNQSGYRPTRFVGVTFTSDILTMVISIILVTAINYLISKLIVFRKDKPSDAEKVVFDQNP